METNATSLMSGLKTLLSHYNLFAVQYSSTQYLKNKNLKNEHLTCLSKNDKSQDMLVLGIYYNHIFIAKNKEIKITEDTSTEIQRVLYEKTTGNNFPV